MSQIYLCKFDAVSHLRGRNRTYENIKVAVLEAGRFSVFDIETERDGRIFTRLCRDEDLEITLLEYPWTAVKQRVLP